MSDHPSARDLEEFLEEQFKFRNEDRRIDVLEVGGGRVKVHMRFHERMLRPGQTVSGPTLMLVADTAVYMLVLRELGLGAMASVTSSLNINFLKRPKPAGVTGEGKLLRMGRRLAVGDVLLYSDGESEPVAQATVTYALPAK